MASPGRQSAHRPDFGKLGRAAAGSRAEEAAGPPDPADRAGPYSKAAPLREVSLAKLKLGLGARRTPWDLLEVEILRCRKRAGDARRGGLEAAGRPGRSRANRHPRDSQAVRESRGRWWGQSSGSSQPAAGARCQSCGCTCHCPAACPPPPLCGHNTATQQARAARPTSS